MYKGCPTNTTSSLPPSDFSMQEGSLVTNSDVDTQVIHDLMMARIDSDRSGGRKKSNHVVISNCLSCDDLQPCTTRGY
jgi:hypothetical protein